ncbi:MAG: phage tail fiber protein [Geminicoccaceae bacterium]
MSFANRTAKGLLDYLFGKTSVFDTQPTIHVGLSTTAPAEDGTNVSEPVGNNYARVAVAAGDWNAATLADPSLIDNSAAINFPTPSGAWGTVTHFAIFDALTGGNVVASGILTTSRSPQNGDPVSFPIGDLDITLD